MTQPEFGKSWWKADGPALRLGSMGASRCRLLKLFREDFHRLETTHPDIAAHIRATAERRRQARTRQV